MSVSLAESYAYCRRVSRRAGSSFYLSFLTLPRPRFCAMCALYAFMRLSDDLGDDTSVPVAERSIRLFRWRTTLQEALDGADVDHPVFPALANTVRRFAIPAEYLFAVVDGVRMDLEPGEIGTFDDLRRYCFHVAGAVGLCCLHIWGFEGEEPREPALACGIAFQLTNILRDLGEDLRSGRVYLPREDWNRFGCRPAELLHPTPDSRFHALMQFEIERARQHYVEAQPLLTRIDRAGRPMFVAMFRTYRSLLEEIAKRPADVLRQRIQLPRWRRLWIAGDSLLRRRASLAVEKMGTRG